MDDPAPTPRKTAPIQPPPETSPLSGFHQFILANKLPKDSPHTPHAHKLALQVAHNLRFQHGWTDIRLHHDPSRQVSAPSPPRPVISGLPPQRLYMHPDEQIDVLQRQREQRKAGWPDVAPEREWVVPSQLRESWTLRRFAEMFDALSAVPGEKEGGALNFAHSRDVGVEGSESGSGSSSGTPEGAGVANGSSTPNMTANGPTTNGETTTASQPNRWRTGQPKRMLLATLDDDSTVVYYIVHDGLVKPRQN
ncbi:hypothetical protein B0A55_05299 [Friedmanniomyces simplex]|uniref:tRNA-splicing endonuclease subunit Sen15 domain-containing protein n=1 Tax=Friedmanniomyces simplex TaxID=329884 RepID=A0A4U0X8Q5_9PEZI|nr:hypothetical protein B0A55_05299 [Friedmanniomyces simplex]